MIIAILGTGHMGRTLGRGLVRAGHQVVYGTRTPGAASDLPGEVVSHQEAIARGDLVLNALAAARTLDVLPGLAGPLAGKVLIDIGNAVDERMDLIYPDSSLGERIQRALPETRVVKTLNTVGGPIGADPSLLPSATNVFLSGDDAAAKAQVSGLLADLGWAPERQIDLGGIGTARAAEHYFLLFASLMQALRTPAFNIAIVRGDAQ